MRKSNLSHGENSIFERNIFWSSEPENIVITVGSQDIITGPYGPQNYTSIGVVTVLYYSDRKQNIMPVIMMHAIELSRVINNCLNILFFLFIYLQFLTYSYI